jgi:hypothetical protein
MTTNGPLRVLRASVAILIEFPVFSSEPMNALRRTDEPAVA